MATTPQTESVSLSGRRASAGSIISGRYVLCVALLVAGIVGMRGVLAIFDYYIQKDPVPLKKSLARADWTRMAPAYRWSPKQPAEVSKEVIAQLGTHEILQWRLIDDTVAPNDPVRIADIVITYYTGSPDVVPHVPEECLAASGYAPLGPPKTVSVELADGTEVPVKVADYSAPRGGTMTVLYLFHVNGEYATSRMEVRRGLANPLLRYAYFAKLEFRFSNLRNEGAGREPSLAALPRLLDKLIPLLMEEHIAWDEVTGASATGDQSDAGSEG